ncbi:MAG TPA: glycosyltransferase [Xanthobacteraceae bacterium]|nr:glycosyltransferase [Xanthobacteraceae bacterium]
MKLDIVVFGLSITSSWGNGHATTYRALLRALAARGHRITFVERDVPWYREHRDARALPYCRIELYDQLKVVPRRFGDMVRKADLVILGSYVPDGAMLGEWITTTARGITAFYDIDTPVTLKNLERGEADYIATSIIPRFDLYLSFTGGPALELIEELFGGRRARALYCAVDPEQHFPVQAARRWALGFLGTYSEDRQAALERLLLEPARRLPDRRFVVAGAQYPNNINWPANVERIEHLPPASHRAFYCAQSYTLNLTRCDMAAIGFSPSVRIFEAAACGVPVISDRWPGIDKFLAPGKEILLGDTTDDVLHVLAELPERLRRMIAGAARKRILESHTAHHRALELERYYREANGGAAATDGVAAIA